MELKERILELASASQHVISAVAEHVSRRGSANVQSCHFRLEKEMQRISVASRGILGILKTSSLPNGHPLGDRLRDWLTTDELSTCLDTLRQMERMLQSDTWMHSVFSFVNVLSTVPSDDKIDEVIKLFDSRRNYFHFLLATDVWNYEEIQQSLPMVSHDIEDWQLVEPLLDDAMAVRGNNNFTAPEQRRQMDDSKKLDDILRWLNGLSCTVRQEETLSLRQPDTCTWLCAMPEYESWRNNDNSLLWLQGKPGSGKTVLASFVVDLIKNKRHRGEALAFFYCDFRNDCSTNTAEVMRSLLSQLLCHARNELDDIGELVNDLVKDMDGNISILRNVKRLASFVLWTARLFSHQPSIVVDAVDECNDIENLLDGLLTLAQGGVRLFVTSRPLQIIKDRLRDFTSISMDKMASAISTDIGLHVTRELDSHRRLRDLDPGFKKEIHTTLCDRADGMFRWVHCQIDALNRCATKAEVREVLDNLPVGLDETYQRILSAIDVESPEGKLALRVLVWLVGALRPLKLPELLEGLGIDLEKQTMDPSSGPMLKEALLDACGSLVTYNEDTAILILSHFSVKEYLIGDLTRIRLPRYHIDYQGAHEYLARMCIFYLTLYLEHVHSGKVAPPWVAPTPDTKETCNTTERCSEPPENSMFCKSQKLLNYVLSEGFNHLAYLGSANHVVLEDMVALQLDIQRYPDAWDSICQILRNHKNAIPWPTRKHDFMFYILIAFSSASLLHEFLRRDRTVLQFHCQTNPLVYAAHFGKVQHAEILLLHDARVNERGLVIDASRQALPVEVAVGRRHDVVVNLLLSAGSKVPKRLFALSTYYFKFPVRIVRMLLATDEFVEWTMEPGNSLPSPLRILEQRLPLMYEDDIIFIMRRILQAGIDHTEQDSVQSTVLYFAILGGYRSIVAYLLQIGTPFSPDFITVVSRIAPAQRIPMLCSIVEAGVDVHAHVASGDTVLHLAVTFFGEDCLEAVKVLVGAGSKLFARNAAGKTPLHLALEKGKSSVADYILSRGIPPSDILLAVVESRCPVAWRLGTLRALVIDEANTPDNDHVLVPREILGDDESLETVRSTSCDSCTTRRKTLLDLGIDHGFSLSDCLLLTGDPPPDAPFSVLRSDLSTSLKALIICSLVEKGLDVCGLSADGDTVMHVAVATLDEGQGRDIVELLIGAGCDPFGCAADGKTPLHVALDRKFSLIADYILSIGKYIPPDALFAVLHSTLPASWRAQTITSLISKGVDVHGLEPDGNTLLHVAVLTLDEHWGLDVARHLVDAGCDPVQCTSDGRIPLHFALDRNFSLIADYLLSIDRPLPSDVPFAILYSALPADWKALRITSLIVNGVDVREPLGNGNTLLYASIRTLDEPQALDVAKLLVDVGHDPFWHPASGKTPFHVALDRKFDQVAEYLLSSGRVLPPDAPFAILDSELPTEWRVQAIASAVVDGFEVCGRLADGNTLLHAVVLALDEEWCLNLIELLVGAGSDPSFRNRQGKTIFHIAIEKGYISVMGYLLSLNQALPDDILFSVLRVRPDGERQADMLSMLITEGANTRAVDAVDGSNLLHAAIVSLPYPTGFNSLDLHMVVELLVASGCDAFASDVHGQTPLHLAIVKGYVPIVAYLLSITGSQELPPDIVACALQEGSEGSTWSILLMLVEKGAHVDILTGDGGSLLHMAIKNARTRVASNGRLLDIAKLLVDFGCDPSHCDADDHPPVYLAITEGYVEVVEYLLPRTVPPPHDLEGTLDFAPYSVRDELKELFITQGYVLE